MILVSYAYVCPKCGAPTKYNPERHGLCIDCFLKQHKEKIEEHIKINVTVCVGCGKLRYGKDWYSPTISNFKNILRGLLRRTNLRLYDLTFDDVPEDTPQTLRDLDKALIPVTISISNERVATKHVEIRVQKAFCPLCSKKQSGKYYESVIHLRFKPEMSESVCDTINHFIDTTWHNLQVFETVDVKKEGAKGLVIRWSSKKIGRKFLEYLRGKYSIIILRKYREQMLVIMGKNAPRQITVEKYIIRLV